MNPEFAHHLRESSSEATKALLCDLQDRVTYLRGVVEDFKSQVETHQRLLRPRAAAQLGAVCENLQKQLLLAEHQLQSASHFEFLLQSAGSLHGPNAAIGFFSVLPDDVTISILELLDVQDILRIRSTCKTFALLTEDDHLWQRLFVRSYPHSTLGPPQTEGWMQLFQRKQELERVSWRRAPRVRTLQGHTNHVFMARFDRDHIISSSEDCTVKVWSLSSYECLHTITGHSSYVPTLSMDRDMIVTGSRDTTVRLWHRPTLQTERVLTGYNAEVSTVQLANELVYTASRDGDVKVWDRRSPTVVWATKAHDSDVFCLQVEGNTLATGSWDKTISLYDIRARQKTGILSGHSGGVYCLWFDEAKKEMVSGCHHRDVIVWDMHTHLPIRTIMPHQRGVRWLDSDGRKIATGSIDQSIQIIDFNGNVINTLHGHCNYLRYVQFDDVKLVSASYDNTIRVWEFGTS